MNPFTRLLWVSAAWLLAGRLCAAEVPPSGFTPLFDGRDLAGWRASGPEANAGKPHWLARGGDLVGDGNGAVAATERTYGDIELLGDWKAAAHADARMCLRGGASVQISGPVGRAAGEWNHLRIVMVGARVNVWLNGRLTVDDALLPNPLARDIPGGEVHPLPARGPIELQARGGEICWRNLFVREIGSDEACRLLASHGDEAFEPIFNGQNLDGWAGALDDVRVKDGALVWRTGNGTLYWNQPLADFKVRLKFKLTPGANNGLAIRYPGHGIPAYDGMCEVQVLDDNYEKVKGKIDPRQAHGSAYGMVAAARGYQHPMGDWNFQEVTVRGSTVRVELNGTVILDADLSKVDLSRVAKVRGQAAAHPGKDRRSGFFGFAGHFDPVEFTDIQIEKL